jgi:hypothetical protein
MKIALYWYELLVGVCVSERRSPRQLYLVPLSVDTWDGVNVVRQGVTIEYLHLLGIPLKPISIPL